MNRTTDVATSTFASVLRLGAGLMSRPAPRQPEKRLELYDFEACPFCRRVREALCQADFDVMVYPCPKGGTRYRPKAIELGGKAMFPYLVDPNTDRSMYQSADIVKYLVETYGASAPLWLGPLSLVSSGFTSAMRASHGLSARASKLPDRPLELWSYGFTQYNSFARRAPGARHARRSCRTGRHRCGATSRRPRGVSRAGLGASSSCRTSCTTWRGVAP